MTEQSHEPLALSSPKDDLPQETVTGRPSVIWRGCAGAEAVLRLDTSQGRHRFRLNSEQIHCLAFHFGRKLSQ